MGNKEFYYMLGRLIDTEGPKEARRIKAAQEEQAKGAKGSQTPEDIIKDIASKEGIQLDEKDIKDLIKCIKELEEIKDKIWYYSPRN